MKKFGSKAKFFSKNDNNQKSNCENYISNNKNISNNSTSLLGKEINLKNSLDNPIKINENSTSNIFNDFDLEFKFKKLSKRFLKSEKINENILKSESNDEYKVSNLIKGVHSIILVQL